MPLIDWIEFKPGGFFDGARFDFVRGLNAGIGGQGSGKTTVRLLERLSRRAREELAATVTP